MTTPPSLSALVECKRLIECADEAMLDCNAAPPAAFEQAARDWADAQGKAAKACIALVRSLPTAPESAPRPDVSLGELPEADPSLPDALCPYWEEWYRLCERRFALDRVTMSGSTFRAIVDAISAPHYTAEQMREYALSALRAQSPAEGGWLPIESAPRDGSWILVLSDGAPMPAVVRFDSELGKWMNEYSYSFLRLRLWQPLPATPTAIVLRESQAEGKGE